MQPKKEQLKLWTLPSIELGYIFNYLHWRDKLTLQAVCPEMSRILSSSLGWRHFEAGERNLYSQRIEVACLQKYGHFIQHCTLWLGNPCKSKWECMCIFDYSNTDDIFPTLATLVDRCRALKSLRIYHPSHLVTSQSNDTDIFKSYQKSIEKLLIYALAKNNFKLELCGLQYSCDHIRPMSLRFLDYYISNPQVLKLVTVLDISRATESSLQPPSSLTCLRSMTSLKTLKLPIQYITTGNIQALVHQCLKDLYLVNDDSTLDLEFKEQDSIDWSSLKVPDDKHLHVHYIFRQRTVFVSNLVPNPFVKSVCLDSLCNPVTEDLLFSIGENYGGKLQILAFTHSAWLPNLQLLDISQFSKLCLKLTHFISTVPLSSITLISLVQNTKLLQEVVIVGDLEDYDMQKYIIPVISEHLQRDWRPHNSPTTMQLDGCELSFLLDESTLRC